MTREYLDYVGLTNNSRNNRDVLFKDILLSNTPFHENLRIVWEEQQEGKTIPKVAHHVW